MAGIISYGAYIPKYRLARDLIAQAWGSASMKGEKAVTNYDEDSITMAVEAAFDCLGDADPKAIDNLYFASTTAPYKEKLSASLIAAVLDLRGDILATDFANSLRAGTSALKAGMDAIESGSAEKALITIADCRLGAVNSEFEQSSGDGAAAFILGNSDTVANIVGDYSVSDEFLDYWRTSEDIYEQSWETRFAIEAGYNVNVEKVVVGIMERLGLTAEDFSKVILYAPDPRRHRDIARRLGFDVKSQLSDLMFSTVGNTGTALVPMMLVATLEQAKPGDKLLLVSYGDGAHALVLEVTDNIKRMRGRRGIKGHLASKAALPNYEMYMRFRELVTMEVGRALVVPSSAPALWRGRKSFLSFYGSRCKRCSTIQHPIQRVCFHCQSVDEYEELKLAKTGKVYTYSEDYITERARSPRISSVIILDDGARVDMELIEVEAQNPLDRPQKIGMPIEMTFRKIRDASGFHNYYWKARPVRGET